MSIDSEIETIKNATNLIKEQSQQLQSKDQQIKDLEALLKIADGCIELWNYMDISEYDIAKQSYQTKYPKQ